MEAGSVSTAASTPSAISWPAISVRFSADPLPAKASSWATMGAIGAGGWRDQTASIGLSSQATSSPPAFSQPARKRLNSSGVCSHGSKPTLWPGRRFAPIQSAAGRSVE